MAHIMNTGVCPPMGKCIPQETVITNVRLAAAYVPYQKLCTLFSPIEALKHGTVFPELYSPYHRKERIYNPCGCK
ncbi:Spore coat associated protein CotJA [Clostridium liquoris]|uniref:Spore coat associated protein CotJA n=1 Tax=Clostridium liquoris TaxID=1289519 RepID=A0A2T0B1Z8_9CLOT|nr:spore coat associated protein CotJA [Clostridium liquoris]PRR77908.1 Spore coat associated protein CotJA [Clostridium liquoris]